MQNSVGFIQVLRNQRFLRLWLGQVISAIGDYFYFLAMPILINKLTGSTAAIGLAMIFGFALPQLLFGLLVKEPAPTVPQATANLAAE